MTTLYRLKNITNLNSEYSLKFYEGLKQYEKIGVRIYELKELKKFLGVEKLYDRFYDFKRRILLVTHLAIMGDHKITTIEAIKIYDSSKGNIDVISKVYNHFKNKKANNFIGLLIAQVRPGVFKEDKKNYNKGVFNDFLQHGYTPEQCIDMEKKLLGD